MTREELQEREINTKEEYWWHLVKRVQDAMMSARHIVGIKLFLAPGKDNLKELGTVCTWISELLGNPIFKNLQNIYFYKTMPKKQIMRRYTVVLICFGF